MMMMIWSNGYHDENILMTQKKIFGWTIWCDPQHLISVFLLGENLEEWEIDKAEAGRTHDWNLTGQYGPGWPWNIPRIWSTLPPGDGMRSKMEEEEVYEREEMEEKTSWCREGVWKEMAQCALLDGTSISTLSISATSLRFLFRETFQLWCTWLGGGFTSEIQIQIQNCWCTGLGGMVFKIQIQIQNCWCTWLTAGCWPD